MLIRRTTDMCTMVLSGCIDDTCQRSDETAASQAMEFGGADHSNESEEWPL